MVNISDCYSGIFTTLRDNVDAVEANMLMINETADNFDSSVLGIACSIFTTEGIWQQFRHWVKKTITSENIHVNTAVCEEVYYCWKQFFSIFNTFMNNMLNLRLCQCDGDDNVCPFSRKCQCPSDLSSVSATHFNSRIISIKIASYMLPFWQGVLQDDDENGSGTELSLTERYSSTHCVDIFNDSSGNDVLLQGISCLVLSTKMPDHSCVTVHNFKKGTCDKHISFVI